DRPAGIAAERARERREAAGYRGGHAAFRSGSWSALAVPPVSAAQGGARAAREHAPDHIGRLVNAGAVQRIGAALHSPFPRTAITASGVTHPVQRLCDVAAEM